MAAALALMAKVRGPKIAYQALLIPATDASVDTESYHEVAAVRYNGTIHDFALLNALRHVPSTEAALQQVEDGIREHLKP